MNANGKFNMVSAGFLGTLLFITALFLVSHQFAQVNSRLSSGVGETYRIEGRSLPVASLATGMGDLRRFERQQELLDAAPEVTTGIGDLRLFEAQQAHSAPAGMGDLHRFEAGQ